MLKERLKHVNNRYLTEVVAERFNMLSRYQPSEGNYQTGGQKQEENQASPPKNDANGPGLESQEDDLPF